MKKTIDSDKDYPVIKRFKGKYNPKDDIGGVWGLERLIDEDPSQLEEFDQMIVQMSLEDFRNPWFL